MRPAVGSYSCSTMADDLPTPRSISRTGYRVHVWCKACRRAKDADLAALIDAGQGDVPLVRLRWRCGNCGSRLTYTKAGYSSRRSAPRIGLNPVMGRRIS